ncbi:ThiF family protein [Ancylostoma caninum]|uniref:SUMO-activating enzyme subunit 1 n=1 Tax=Ancylostoma caninum TaxID=29170 RepID=A0A368FYZ0_ANCCA|nr:ThiF family protein [Ancylostoma caninum]
MSIGVTSEEPSATPSGDNGSEGLSKVETEVYDRQIRLWGMEAQNKLRAANVLLCGLSGLGAEISKNLMLCGIRSLTLTDEKNVTEEDVDSNFLLENNSIGKNRARASSQKARALNPMVKLEVLEASVSSVSPEFVSNFTLVVLCDQKYSDVVFWNEKCRQLKIGFIACSVFGWMGFSFFDFNDHYFLRQAWGALLTPKKVLMIIRINFSAAEKKQDAVCDGDGGGTSSAPEAIDVDAENVLEKKKYQYPSIEEAFNVDWSKKQLVRKSRRVIPCSYFPLKAMLRAQKEGKLCADDEKNLKILTELWTEEVTSLHSVIISGNHPPDLRTAPTLQVLIANHEIEKQTVQAENFDYFFGPQLSPVCAIVGGLAGQEAIKAMSENGRPLRNIFIYSALDSTGTMCMFPPP